jgi:hypothetical protein
MADPAPSPDPDHDPDDEIIFSTPNRRAVITAGNCARIEQRRLEKETGLQDGRTPKRDPGGYFP